MKMNRRTFLTGLLLSPLAVKLGLPPLEAGGLRVYEEELETEVPDTVEPLGSKLSEDGFLTTNYLFTDVHIPPSAQLEEDEEFAEVFFVPEGSSGDVNCYYVGRVPPAGYVRQIATPPYPFRVVVGKLKNMNNPIVLRTWTYAEQGGAVVRMEGDTIELRV